MGVWGALLQGVLSIDSGIIEGQQAAKQAKANIEQANDAAADAKNRGAIEAGQARTQGSQVAAEQNVAFANSGVRSDVGTALEVQANTAAQAELSAQTQKNNAAREAWGFKKHGMAYQAQAGLDAAKRNKETAGTILTSAGNAYAAYGKSGWGV